MDGSIVVGNDGVYTPEQLQALVNEKVKKTMPVSKPVDLDATFKDHIATLQGSKNLAGVNMMQDQYNQYGTFRDYAKGIDSIFQGFNNESAPLYNNFIALNQGLDKDITGKLQDQLKVAYSQYGPDGSQTKMADEYFKQMADTISAQNAVNTGNIVAAGQASGANTGAQRQALFASNIEAQEKNLNMKKSMAETYDKIYTNLNSYIDNFVKTYANSKNQYVLPAYQALMQYKQGVQEAAMNSRLGLLEAATKYGMARKNPQQDQNPQAIYVYSGTDENGNAILVNQEGKQVITDPNTFANYVKAGYVIIPSSTNQ